MPNPRLYDSRVPERIAEHDLSERLLNTADSAVPK
jgi:hypothetical protein